MQCPLSEVTVMGPSQAGRQKENNMDVQQKEQAA